MVDQELSNPEIVSLAVYRLGGAINSVDLEDIAIEAFKLTPKRFSWKKFEDRIDLRIVLYSVNDAIKSDNGYIKGNSKYGYMLTEAGLKRVEEIENQKIFINSSRKYSSKDLENKEKIRLQRTNAYKKFINGIQDQINIMDFREFTRVNDYFPQHVKEQRFAKIQNLAEEDKAIGKVLEFLIDKFVRSNNQHE